MSGGSFNYLYVKNEHELPHEDLLHMIAELENRGWEDAAAATRYYLTPVVERDDPIRTLWYAVEWHVSGDYGSQQAESAYTWWRSYARKHLEDQALQVRAQLAALEALIVKFTP